MKSFKTFLHEAKKKKVLGDLPGADLRQPKYYNDKDAIGYGSTRARTYKCHVCKGSGKKNDKTCSWCNGKGKYLSD